MAPSNVRSALTLAALASALVVSAEDVLYSKRLSKRYIDADGNWNQSFFHINDVHAHLDQFRSSGTDCTDPTRGCFGGYARVSTVVNERRPVLNSSLFLNAGDEFQGTLFYSYYGGEKIAETINQLGFDGMTLGNHEFVQPRRLRAIAVINSCIDSMVVMICWESSWRT